MAIKAQLPHHGVSQNIIIDIFAQTIWVCSINTAILQQCQ